MRIMSPLLTVAITRVSGLDAAPLLLAPLPHAASVALSAAQIRVLIEVFIPMPQLEVG
ncbi:hypothetical protein XVE_4306 [Xanthomonas vesicatoria ATCC 35937]|uniref:Uncharacterized protein n=1 Tax=Xanthomonas vesicatoria ATCC 35937 TaxID=925775 RepID=F0BJ48_9XANT|nr:hypothetical protein XVE_4306 [Xanthomonas vesicatoria ATCC 35937]